MEPTFDCHDARASIQSYLDGELSEERAAPLRRHLLDCQPCRASAQSEKNLKRWFSKAQTPAPAVPRDFASRVARRAFAGDPGERFSDPRTITAGSTAGAMAPVRMSDERNLRFVLSLTAAAALLLVVFSIALQRRSLPSTSSLEAQTSMSLEDAHRALERLNQEPAGAPLPRAETRQ